MTLTAHGRPDGSFEVAGTQYRLDQHGDHFVVIRAADGERVGGFVLNDLPGPRGAAVIDGDTTEPAVVKAIAQLVSQPRGLLPLQ
jgi:nitrous oxide reductase accessory protein NosL